MKNIYLYSLCAILVFTVFFSTVAPSDVFAVDIAQITNSVHTSSNTGGQSGSDGQDGQDGQPGAHGQSGKDGSSVINGESTATIHVQSSINGEKVVDVYQTKASNDAAVVLETYTATTTSDGNPEIDNDLENSNETVSAERDLNGIQHVLSSIRLILLRYVNFLF